MIIKIFHQGQGKADFITDYLLSEEKHAGHKHEVLEGEPEITKKIINSLKFKNKYITGVIGFRYGEDLTRLQQHELVERFEKTLCPFSDPARTNFLWVKHFDKGRLELHFLMPKVDLRTGKAFNLHPPGKANLLFFESFIRMENLRHGFAQVDNKDMSAKDAKFYADVMTDLYAKRKSYLTEKYDRIKTTNRKETKYGRKSGPGRHVKQFTQFRSLSDVCKFKADLSRGVQWPNGTRTNRNEAGSLGINEKNNGNREIDTTNEGYSKYSGNAVETPTRIDRSAAPIGLPKVSMSVDDELYLLGVQLNTCDRADAPALITRLNYLQGVKSRQDEPYMSKDIKIRSTKSRLR
ncbi:relaxase/mobilization nuclease domain-containing protein [Massilia sp. GCM10023247]|uniref:relaxase/mobilization nuclease domain-containing protein n=1 Tax=Massilia sp. GCM10023247 TaxID=3252643 RepID=UPI0036091121